MRSGLDPIVHQSIGFECDRSPVDRSPVDSVLNAMGFGPDARTEQLSVDTLLEMCERFRQIAPELTLS